MQRGCHPPTLCSPRPAPASAFYGSPGSERQLTGHQTVGPPLQHRPAWTELAVKANESCQRALQVAPGAMSPGGSPGPLERSQWCVRRSTTVNGALSPQTPRMTQWDGNTLSSPMLYASPRVRTSSPPSLPPRPLTRYNSPPMTRYLLSQPASYRQGSPTWSSSMLKTSTTCLASTPCLAQVGRSQSPPRVAGVWLHPPVAVPSVPTSTPYGWRQVQRPFVPAARLN